jgi:uncharacterized protein YajQ (UPF0234 family)
MGLEIDNTFVKAGVSPEEAKAAVESINKEIDKRYSVHASQLSTKSDLAELKTELIKAIAESQRWTITAIFAAVGLFAALSKVLH